MGWSFEHSADSAAAPEAVWTRDADVKEWAAWSPGVEWAELDGPFAIDLHAGGTLTGRDGEPVPAVGALTGRNQRGNVAFDTTVRYAFGFEGEIQYELKSSRNGSAPSRWTVTVADGHASTITHVAPDMKPNDSFSRVYSMALIVSLQCGQIGQCSASTNSSDSLIR